MKSIFCIILVIVACFRSSHQHGSLMEPPARNVAWLVDDDFKECCTSYDYNEQNCGGTSRQWRKNDGKCGVCGDPWDSDRPYEKGGERYIGKIMRTYKKGSAIDVEISVRFLFIFCLDCLILTICNLIVIKANSKS